MKEQVLAVQRMQEYIEAHLSDAITPADLSKASLFSPWHSYRLFKQLVGITPSDYIRRLRLSRSAQRLLNGVETIASVACDMGFGSVDGYQRAFFREFGCNPSQYAQSPIPIPLFIPYGVKYQNLFKEESKMETKNIFIQTVEKPKRRVIVKRGVKADEYMSYCEEVGCDIWGILVSMKSLCGEPVCMWLPDKYVLPGTSVYVQGVEAPAQGDITVPEGFDVFELPAAKYLMFQGEPFEEEHYGDAIAEIWAAMKKYNPAVIGCEWNDSQPRIQLAPIGERGYIELRAIREKGNA